MIREFFERVGGAFAKPHYGPKAFEWGDDTVLRFVEEQRDLAQWTFGHDLKEILPLLDAHHARVEVENLAAGQILESLFSDDHDGIEAVYGMRMVIGDRVVPMSWHSSNTGSHFAFSAKQEGAPFVRYACGRDAPEQMNVVMQMVGRTISPRLTV